MAPTLQLDLDESTGAVAGALRPPLQAWHDRLRFACSTHELRRFGALLSAQVPERYGTALLGSGDFHHLSLPLIERAAQHARVPFRVVVFDNHPDNMRFPFGVHCGSWVWRAAALPAVSRVDVVGITSSDIGLAHSWENHLRPLYRGKLRYWSTGVTVGWAKRIGLAGAFRDFASMEQLSAAFLGELDAEPGPTYLSIDKDVLAVSEARTNWDQGQMRMSHLLAAIERVRDRLVGSDITGEVSIAQYRQWWKRCLSALDAQPRIDAEQLSLWQAQQHAINARLLRALAD